MQVELENEVLRMPSHLCRIQWQRSDGFQWAEPKSWIMLSADIEILVSAQLWYMVQAGPVSASISTWVPTSAKLREEHLNLTELPLTSTRGGSNPTMQPLCIEAKHGSVLLMVPAAGWSWDQGKVLLLHPEASVCAS